MTQEKINVAELLSNCPKGMELDCYLFNGLEFDHIDKNNGAYPIICRVKTEFGGYNIHTFTEYGCYSMAVYSKCVIFPKGKTTWEGFVPPSNFKDGDIIFTYTGKYSWISIFKQCIENSYCTYIDLYINDNILFTDTHRLYDIENVITQRRATKEEKEKLFQAIKNNGYKWNEETKTLEKLIEPKFKIEKGKWYVCIRDLLDNYSNKAFRKGDTYLSTQDGSLIPSNSNVPFEVFCPDTYFRDWTIEDAKDGDVLAINWHEGNDSWEKIVIFKKYHNNGVEGLINSPCVEGYGNTFKNGKLVFHEKIPYFSKTWTANLHPATKEQRDFLFQKIKEAGCKWNLETKYLEKLPKFKVGDIVQYITDSTDRRKIEEIDTLCNMYHTDSSPIMFEIEDEWEIVPNKFDIATLKPFDKVLVRDAHSQVWTADLFSHKVKEQIGGFVCIGHYWHQCIPYKGNEYLLGTNNDCNEFFKTW